MGYNILVVDDSDTVRSVFEKTLRLAEVDLNELYKASDGEEALQLLRDNWIDLVITDLNMPGMNGTALIEKMQEDKLLSSIPVVVVTTEGNTKRISDLREKGISGYVRKPFTPEQIKEMVDNVMEAADA